MHAEFLIEMFDSITKFNKNVKISTGTQYPPCTDKKNAQKIKNQFSFVNVPSHTGSIQFTAVVHLGMEKSKPVADRTPIAPMSGDRK